MTRNLEAQTDRFIPLTPVVFGIMMSPAAQERHGYAILHDVRTRAGGRLRLETGPRQRRLRIMREVCARSLRRNASGASGKERASGGIPISPGIRSPPSSSHRSFMSVHSLVLC